MRTWINEMIQTCWIATNNFNIILKKLSISVIFDCIISTSRCYILFCMRTGSGTLVVEAPERTLENQICCSVWVHVSTLYEGIPVITVTWGWETAFCLKCKRPAWGSSGGLTGLLLRRTIRLSSLPHECPGSYGSTTGKDAVCVILRLCGVKPLRCNGQTVIRNIKTNIHYFILRIQI